MCLPLPWVEVGERLVCIIHSVSPSTLCEGGGEAHLYHPQCVSLYLGWGSGSFVSSTSVSPSTLSEGGGGAHLYHPQCVSLYLGWRRGSFVSSTSVSPSTLGEGWGGAHLICIIHSVSPSTLSEGGGGAHLYHSQCVSLLLGWGSGSFVSSTVCLPLTKVGEWLICIIYSVSPSTLGEGGGGAHLICIIHSVSPSTLSEGGGVAHLYHPQCVSLYLGWGSGSFVSSTVCLPLTNVGEWLICIIYSVSPSTLGEGGGGAHLYHPQCVSSLKVEEGLICIIHSVSPDTN